MGRKKQAVGFGGFGVVAVIVAIFISPAGGDIALPVAQMAGIQIPESVQMMPEVKGLIDVTSGWVQQALAVILVALTVVGLGEAAKRGRERFGF